MKKRIVSVILSLIILLSAYSFAFAKEDVSVTVSNGFGKATSTATVSWDEGWFLSPAVSYNHSLASFSMALSGAAYVATYKQSLETPLINSGFDNITPYYSTPTRDDCDTVSYTFASQPLSDGSLLTAIVVKGTGGNAEWYSNFNIGYDLTHAGFKTASDKLIENFNHYIASVNTHNSPVKVLVTGHSRGGAVANIVAAQLTDTLGRDNVYAYTFATPNVTVSENAKSDSYSNIFNIINPEDFVSNVPLSGWGYTRYGVDLFLPTVSVDTYDNFPILYERMKANFYNMTGEEFDGYEDGTRKIKNLTQKALRLAPTVEDYYTKEHYLVYPNPIFKEAEYATTSDYFNFLAAFCAEGDLNALKSMGKALTGEFASISAFFITQSGAGIGDLKFNASVWCAHCPATYLSWLLTSSEAELFGYEKAFPFNDVIASSPYYDAISYVYKNNLMTGVSQDTFSPFTTTTRAMIVTILHRASASPIAAAGNTFSDVKDNFWYTDAICWANENSIVTGYGNSNFGPDDNITREQLVTILYRYALLKGFDTKASENLPDSLDVSEYAKEAYLWAISNSLIDTSLLPKGDATRAEVAYAIAKLIIAN